MTSTTACWRLPLFALVLAAMSAAWARTSAADPLIAPNDSAIDSARNAKVAMAASALFPGLGQLYDEEGIKTLAVFVWESYYIATIVREGREADFYRRRAAALEIGETWEGLGRAQLRTRFHRHEKREVDTIWYGSALLLASILDAYVFAYLHHHETDAIRGPKGGILPCIDPGSRALGIQWRTTF